MQRQRNAKATKSEQTAATMVVEKKKGKKIVEEVEEEERKDGVELVPLMVEESLVGEYWDFDELPLMSGVVDEQMSWGSIWLPICDIGQGEMFSDVVWDDDIWNLRSVDKIPDS